MRGIETVRRDWCPLVSETMMNILNIILKEGDVQKSIDMMKIKSTGIFVITANYTFATFVFDDE